MPQDLILQHNHNHDTLDQQFADTNISAKIGDHLRATEIQLSNEPIKHIPARRFDRQQKPMAKCSA
jgi:hypothetical protein